MTGGQITLAGSDNGLCWAVSHKPKQRGAPSGDGYVIWRSGSEVFFAVSDGSGSGPEASAATETCLKALTAGHDAQIPEAFIRCHAALKGSRGVALGMAVVDLGSGDLNWAAVGDIDGLLVRSETGGNEASLIQSGGILGVNLPKVSVQNQTLRMGDLILLSSDGINRNYRASVSAQAAPKATVDAIMTGFSQPADDSIVLAMSYFGGAQ
jgi:serine phosphatase RsbU (regulator of sigma subunit)